MYRYSAYRRLAKVAGCPAAAPCQHRTVPKRVGKTTLEQRRPRLERPLCAAIEPRFQTQTDTGGGKGILRAALMRNTTSRDCPVRSLRHSLRQQDSVAAWAFRFRPPGTGSKRADWRRSGAVLLACFRAAVVRFEPDASRARLRFKAAMRSMTSGGAAISLALTVSPFILASSSSRKASW